MLDDFFYRALIATFGLAIISGPLGCFVTWRKMAYFGDTMAHSALLGIACSLLLEIQPLIGVFLVTLIIAFLLFALKSRSLVSNDTLLGILSHTTLAFGLVLLAFMSWLRVDITTLLFGEILSVSVSDIVYIYACGAAILAVIAYLWRSLVTTTINPDLALVEGLHPARSEFIFLILMAAVITISIKIVGVLLITAMLIMPAATARRYARSPEQMAVLAIATGVCASVTGLYSSLYWDIPSGPAIVVTMATFFLLSTLPTLLKRAIRR